MYSCLHQTCGPCALIEPTLSSILFLLEEEQPVLGRPWLPARGDQGEAQGLPRGGGGPAHPGGDGTGSADRQQPLPHERLLGYRWSSGLCYWYVIDYYIIDFISGLILLTFAVWPFCCLSIVCWLTLWATRYLHLHKGMNKVSIYLCRCYVYHVTFWCLIVFCVRDIFLF